MNRTDHAPRALVDSRGKAEADGGDSVDPQALDDLVQLGEQLLLGLLRRPTLTRRSMRPSRSTTPAAIFVPPTSTPIARSEATWLRYAASGPGRKPYRVYREDARRARADAAQARAFSAPPRPKAAPVQGARSKVHKPKGKANWRRRILVTVIILFVLLIVWAVASYLALRSGAEEANERLPDSAKAALVPQDGLVLIDPSVILLLGTDHSSRIWTCTGFRRADSIMLLRTDPSKGRLNYPRSLATCASTSRAPASRRSIRRMRSAARRSRFAPCAASPTSR